MRWRPNQTSATIATRTISSTIRLLLLFNQFSLREGRQRSVCQRRQLREAQLIAAIVLVDHARHVSPSLLIRRNPVPAVHRRRTRVVSSQRQRKIVLVALQQRVQIGGSPL